MVKYSIKECDKKKKDMTLIAYKVSDDSKIKSYIYLDAEKDPTKRVEHLKIEHDEKFQPVPIIKSNEKNTTYSYVAGASGCGKSYFVAKWIENLKKQSKFKDHDVYVISPQTEDDPAFEKLGYFRLDITFPDFAQLTFEDFKDSIVVFDDLTSLHDKRLSFFITMLQKACLENGRKLNISVISVNHALKDWMKTKYVIGESPYYTIFPNSNYNECAKFLKSYASFDKFQLEYVKELDTRALTIHRNSPNYMISDHEIILF